MQIRFLMGALALLSACAFAASPAPQPVKPNAIQFTQGSVTRTLAVPAGAKAFTYSEILISGQRRFAIGGQWVQFPNSGGAVSSVWKFPTAQCPPLPPDASQTMDCAVTNPGTTGTWTQTHGWVQTPPLQGCVVSALPWTPTVAPDGACTPIQPPHGLQPMLLQTQLLSVAKPARGVPFTTQYGTTETRITDHAVDRPGSSCARNDYSRRQAFNADLSRIAVYECGGPWLVYKTNPIAFEKQLNGPGGDSEFQWSPTDPDKAYYMPTNGGCCIYEMTVSTNTHTMYYDMSAQAQALLGPLADRLWTRSEGSPSDDGRVWSFVAQHYNQSTGNFDTLGYIAFDVIAHQVLWSNATSVAIDHISTSHSGRYAVPSGDTTYAVRLSDGATCTLNYSSQHSDTIVLPGGHDGFASIDYDGPSGLGDFIIVDIDQCFADGHATRRTLSEHIYNNPKFGTEDGNCGRNNGRGSCSFHISGRASQRPGWVFYSNYGRPRLSLFAYDYAADKFYGIGVGMTDTNGYFTETQAAVSRDGRSIMFNDTFGTGTDVDDYRIDLP